MNLYVVPDMNCKMFDGGSQGTIEKAFLKAPNKMNIEMKAYNENWKARMKIIRLMTGEKNFGESTFFGIMRLKLSVVGSLTETRGCSVISQQSILSQHRIERSTFWLHVPLHAFQFNLELNFSG